MDKEIIYIGPKIVEDLVVTPEKSFKGDDILLVKYSGGTTEILTRKTFELISTKEPSDYTSIREKQFDAVKKELYVLLGTYISSLSESDNKESKLKFLQETLILLAEYSVKQRDLDKIFDTMAASITGSFQDIGNSIDENYNRVTNFLWTGDDKKFIPGVHPMSDITFLETKKFLDIISKNEKVN